MGAFILSLSFSSSVVPLKTSSSELLNGLLSNCKPFALQTCLFHVDCNAFIFITEANLSGPFRANEIFHMQETLQVNLPLLISRRSLAVLMLASLSVCHKPKYRASQGGLGEFAV